MPSFPLHRLFPASATVPCDLPVLYVSSTFFHTLLSHRRRRRRRLSLIFHFSNYSSVSFFRLKLWASKSIIQLLNLNRALAAPQALFCFSLSKNEASQRYSIGVANKKSFPNTNHIIKVSQEVHEYFIPK